MRERRCGEQHQGRRQQGRRGRGPARRRPRGWVAGHLGLLQLAGAQEAKRDRDRPLDEPERGCCADHIGGQGLEPLRPGHLEASERPGEAQAERHEQQLARLDAEVEEQQRQRNLGRGQTDLAERARKAQAVQQAEGEGDQPGEPVGEAEPTVAAAQDLGAEEDDAERDQRIDRPRRHVEHAEGRERERQAVGDREGGHGLDQHPGPPDDQEQPEHEQQVVDPEQDVLDAERQVALCGGGERAGAGPQRRERHFDGGAAAAEEPTRARAVQPARGEQDALALPGETQDVACMQRLTDAIEDVAKAGRARPPARRGLEAAACRQTWRRERLGRAGREVDVEGVAARRELLESGARDPEIVRRGRQCQPEAEQQGQ